MKYKKMLDLSFHGYTPDTGEENPNEIDKSTRDNKEGFNFTDKNLMDKTKYPSEVPQLYPSVMDLYSASSSLARKVLIALGHYLKLKDPNYLLQFHTTLEPSGFTNPDSIPLLDIRTNFYPAMSRDAVANLPEGSLRLNAHSDWGTITFLFQDDAGGLEAKGVDRKWHSVEPIEETIVVNAGLMLEAWSGGHILATEHRVQLVKDKMDRFRQSIAFFVAPDGQTKVDLLVDPRAGWKWSTDYPEPGKVTFDNYVKDRIKGIYGTQAY